MVVAVDSPMACHRKNAADRAYRVVVRSIVSTETLADLQLTVLKALTDVDTIWECDGTLPALLKGRGLPATKSKTRQLVNKRIK